MNLEIAGEKSMLQLNELEEFRQDANESSRIYTDKTKSWHDKHLVNRGNSTTFQFKIEIVPEKAQIKMVRAFYDHKNFSLW